ncbi:MAG: hypothetical protein KF902_12410 [Phycisphaeraceae bacterium]|nr:hypothetical protein [Phycisphaeraceae bacterium]
MRRRHPLQAGWRRWRGVQRAIRQVVFLTIGTAAMLAGSIGGAALTLDYFRAIGTSWTRLHRDVLTGRVSQWRAPEWMQGSGEPFSPIMLVMFSVLGGVVLSAGLTHWKRWMLIPAWLGLWNVVVFLPLMTHKAVVLFERVCAWVLSAGPVYVPRGSGGDFTGTYDLAAASMYSIAPFAFGMLGGSLARRLSAMNARRRWIKRRRWLRRRRESR